MLCRRYTPGVNVTFEPWPMLFGPKAEDPEDAYGVTRVVADVCIRSRSAGPFHVHVSLTPEWSLPFPTECEGERAVRGSLPAGEAYHFRVTLDAPHEMASAELAAAVMGGDVDVILLGWDTA